MNTRNRSHLHELLTYLNNIKTYCQTIDSEVFGILTHTQHEMLDTVLKNCDQLESYLREKIEW
ncbi:hypothetical protein JW905_04650 [bacterium]|nr:hypothetical protein [candidate division CSSED10-310 bacterium]